MAGQRTSRLESTKVWSGRGDLNARPPAPKRAELFPKALSFLSVFQHFQQLGESAFSLIGNPSHVNRSGFGTVLPHSISCAGPGLPRIRHWHIHLSMH